MTTLPNQSECLSMDDALKKTPSSEHDGVLIFLL